MKQYILFNSSSIPYILNECARQNRDHDHFSIFNLDSAKTSIAASNKQYGECFAKGDLVKFVDSYTSEACIYVTIAPKMCGPQAINAFINGGYSMGIRNLKLTTKEVSVTKEAVFETGTYEIFADKRVSIDKGKFIVIWKEESGQKNVPGYMEY